MLFTEFRNRSLHVKKKLTPVLKKMIKILGEKGDLYDVVVFPLSDRKVRFEFLLRVIL